MQSGYPPLATRLRGLFWRARVLPGLPQPDCALDKGACSASRLGLRENHCRCRRYIRQPPPPFEGCQEGHKAQCLLLQVIVNSDTV